MFLSAGESHALQEVCPHRGSTCWLRGQAVRCPLWTPIDHHYCHLDPMGASRPRLLGMCRPYSPLITGQSACHSLSQHLHWFPSHSSPLCSPICGGQDPIWSILGPHDLTSHQSGFPSSSSSLYSSPFPSSHSTYPLSLPHTHDPVAFTCLFIVCLPLACQRQEGEDPLRQAHCCLPDL